MTRQINSDRVVYRLGFRRVVTECKRGHAFTVENTYRDKTGRQHCRTCKRNRRERLAIETGRPRRTL